MITKVHFSMLQVGKFYNVLIFNGRRLVKLFCVAVTNQYARMYQDEVGEMLLTGEVEIYERPKPY